MLISFLITTFLSATLIFLLIENASSLGLVAVPNNRSVHKKITPCGAGIAFIGAFFIGVTIYSWGIYSAYFLTSLAVVLIFILGIYDDLKHSSSHAKFLIIIIATLMIFIEGLRIESIGNYFEKEANLFWLSFPVTLFAVVGFTNALNLIDGLDGLAGTISLIILSGLSYIGYIHQDDFIFTTGAILFPTLVIFLAFNWNPARVFMGDSGSLTLGFIIAVLSIKSLDYIDPVSILFIAAIPILDTVTVMVRRKLSGHSMVSADKNHLHHIILNTFNGNVKKTVLLISGIQLVFTLFGVLLTNQIGQELTLPLFFICLIVFYFVTERIRGVTNLHE